MGASDWVSDDVMAVILAAMTPENRLAVEVSLATGLRISDVLSMKIVDVQRTARPYVRDSKTGKLHRIYLPVELRRRMLQIAGSIYVFEGRADPKKHRTRQAVYKDMVAAAEVAKHGRHVGKAVQVTPHTARKKAAVDVYHSKGFEAAQELLCHDPDHPLVTMVYALSDTPELKLKRKRKRKKVRRYDGSAK